MVRGQSGADDGKRHPVYNDTIWVVSPIFGYNHNNLQRPNPQGGKISLRKSAPEYGFYGMVANPRYVINDFLFYTKAHDDADVFGNLLYVNLYGSPESSLAWNIGGGYLYHKIEPRNMDIRVNVPMAKVGVRGRIPSLGITLNPYVGYAWEKVGTRLGDTDNDSILYGLAVDWRWRMLNVNARYYYQDSRDLREHYNNFHLLFVTGITRNCGAMIRLDHMEHALIRDTSVMAGPVFVF